jgi:hypothetical protein
MKKGRKESEKLEVEKGETERRKRKGEAEGRKGRRR